MCLVLPSAPRNVHASIVNQTALEIQWLPPAIVGDQTQVFYDVDCSKPCSKDDGNECVDQTCGGDVIFVPYKDGLNMTQVIITNLSSFLKYTIKVYARNRVSELAKRKYRIKGTFTAITVRTNGSGEFKFVECTQYSTELCYPYLTDTGEAIYISTKITYTLLK